MDAGPQVFGLLCGGFFFLVTLAGGIGLIFFSKRSKKKAGLSQAWPSVPGTITRSEVQRNSSSDEDGGTSYFYTPAVEYTYSAGGQDYTGKRISFGGTAGHSSPAKSQAVLANYPLNSTVLVFYDPAKPGDAVLERAAGGGTKAAMIIGIILIVISVMIACPLLIMAFSGG